MASMELISTYTVGSGGVASVTFSSIPNTYKDLLVVSSLSNAGSYVGINSQTTGYYAKRMVYFDGYPVRTYQLNNSDAWRELASPGWSSYGAFFGTTVFYIANYANTSYGKSVATLVEGTDINANADYYYRLYMQDGYHGTTSAVSTLTFNDGSTIGQYTKISLYGIK